MIDWVKLGELGAVVVALLCVLGLIAIVIEVIRKRYRESGSGERRSQVIVDCPNHIEGLNSTLIALVEECREQTTLNTREIEVLTHNKVCLDTLVQSHAPVAGREWWKTSERSEMVQVEIRDGIRDMKTGITELVRIAKKNGG
jgi:hypothetical protein